ncbi:gustatory receptor for sugar taste 64f-like [Periplaneta americana]|uniref:gustatory receptor for sugar taste 64f-like n=1 Tax=Periplaneta americana TaxID=6978 RepID=UPI0037E745CD
MIRESFTESMPEQGQNGEDTSDGDKIKMTNIPQTHKRIPSRSMSIKKQDTTVMIESEAVDNSESFHTAIGRILVMAQCFGLMPMRGVLARSPSEIQFKYLSLRMVYSSVFLIYLLIIVILSCLYIGREVTGHGTKFLKDIRSIIWGGVFYGNAFLATLLFLRLAPRWANLMDIWRGVEYKLRHWPFPPLAQRFSIITAAIMIPALCEHILSIPMSIPECFYTHTDLPCLKGMDNSTFGIPLNISIIFKLYSNRSHNYIFEVVGYNDCLAVFLLIGYRLAAFIWNFTDLFLILISIGLSERFIQFNTRLQEANRTVIGQKEWQELRQHYNLLSTLVKLVDSEVSGIVLLSFANNLCCIGLQLVKTMSDDTCAYDRTYYFLSFVFLMGRTIMVTVNTSRIHDESKASLHELNMCHPDSQCVEMERLQSQVRSDEIALTGLRTFSVTRSFLLVVAGCVFTYVVVLLQFFVALNPTMTEVAEVAKQLQNAPTSVPMTTVNYENLTQAFTSVPVTTVPYGNLTQTFRSAPRATVPYGKFTQIFRSVPVTTVPYENLTQTFRSVPRSTVPYGKFTQIFRSVPRATVPYEKLTQVFKSVPMPTVPYEKLTQASIVRPPLDGTRRRIFPPTDAT